MKTIYKRIKVNKGLLKYTGSDYAKFLNNEVSDQLPKGEVKGVKFISYIDEGAVISPPDNGGGAFNALPFGMSNTDIFITDTQSNLLTEPTDIRDYQNNGGGYSVNFKKIDEKADVQITIRWETNGTTPICGEFIFEIDQSNCAC
ncbi:hypothetical protein SAMN04489761_4664 [Tenacibaculum sp. MAR_2009_124]|uniref:hypothetical protein n=1 Tax=Tenacibaculum sp. MAR_2009_124 TaxID=1250059 RepID=UPI0008984AA7|nr:hypothetical protein [Tenacibaculum sp. MAR_2009_124]SED21932.1 hypothetical protein SAMN04489761_4664 [Tenacibaculum sp. MAR_2009_124]